MSEIRVDSITDEAGTGAPEITDHYKKSNILGTVFESSGVPTGAIIERGNNANGEYVKYADGTLICFRAYNFGSVSSGSTAGRAALSFPASFVSSVADSVLTSANNWNDNGGGAASKAYTFFSTSSSLAPPEWSVYYANEGNRTHDPAYANLYAVGRWY